MTVGTKGCIQTSSICGPPTHAQFFCACSNAVGGGDCTLSLAWEDATMMPLHVHIYSITPNVASVFLFIMRIFNGASPMMYLFRKSKRREDFFYRYWLKRFIIKSRFPLPFSLLSGKIYNTTVSEKSIMRKL